MFTAQQYRAKAAEFRAFLTNTSRLTYTTLAENEEWMAVHLLPSLRKKSKF
jgi:hypothetical protein